MRGWLKRGHDPNPNEQYLSFVYKNALDSRELRPSITPAEALPGPQATSVADFPVESDLDSWIRQCSAFN